MDEPAERTVRFDWEMAIRPPFGVWRPIGGGLEVRVFGTDPPGSLRIRHLGKADVVHPDGTHEYWSTHCRCSEDHDACNATTINGGPRTPARSKCCDSPCICPCHDQVSGSTEQEN